MPTGSPFVSGQANSANDETSLTATTSPAEAGLEVANLRGSGAAVGSLLSLGLEVASVFGTGLRAEGTVGIRAKGTEGGIIGECIQRGDQSGIIGVAGRINLGGYGVFGTASGAFPDAAVHGRGADGIGVDGLSFRNIGVRGLALAPNGKGCGVLGYGKTTHGVVGMTDTSAVLSPTAPFIKPIYAGWFLGNVLVVGDFIATGSKSAAVEHPDGSLRRLYCIESPESWFEDFGAARLIRGRANIKLDKTFRDLVQAANYHVFLSPEGDSKGLYVTRKTSASFMVREQQKGLSNIRFSYRIVARRKDVRPRRFEKVTRPELPKDLTRVYAEPKLPAGEPVSTLTKRLKHLARQRQTKRVRQRFAG